MSQFVSKSTLKKKAKKRKNLMRMVGGGTIATGIMLCATGIGVGVGLVVVYEGVIICTLSKPIAHMSLGVEPDNISYKFLRRR